MGHLCKVLKTNNRHRIILTSTNQLILNYMQSKTLSQKTQTTTAAFATPNLVAYLLWALFLGNLGYLLASFPHSDTYNIGNLLHINGFTILMWTVVSFFSAIISSYAVNYLHGFTYHNRFMFLTLGFTLSVMTLVMANHVLIILGSWLLMGVLMSRLIGVDRDWAEARAASAFTLRYFLAGTFFLGTGIVILISQTGSYVLDEITPAIAQMENMYVLIAAICMILAAVVQSAIYPFHRWLLSAMTAPTPASALMHAGFVNGSGILLALFASLFFSSNTLDVLLIIGGLTAIIAQFTKLLQVNVKHKLACSTIAQMGFMIMQCGLGFFNAAIAHLILHGFYKAYLFLSSGEEVKRLAVKQNEHITIKPVQAIAVLIYGVAGAFLFTYMTGKEIAWNSSIFLTLIVAITVGQITYNIVKQQHFSLVQKALIPPVLFIAGITLYAVLYNGVTMLMQGMPLVAASQPLTTLQIVFGIVFLIGFFIMKLGIYRKIPWLYVSLMNLSQPYKNSILRFKTKHS